MKYAPPLPNTICPDYNVHWQEDVAYLMQQLRRFIRHGDRVLLCFQTQGPGSLCQCLEQALQSLGAGPLLWGPDFRWKTLLRQAFAYRATAVFGSGSALAALAKMASATGTPLRIRNALLCSDTGNRALERAIGHRLDCVVWTCYPVGQTGTVAAFSCSAKQGLHLRESRFDAKIINPDHNQAISGEIGQLVLTDRQTGAVLETREHGRLLSHPCPCGCSQIRISPAYRSADRVQTIRRLEEQLQNANSILDYQVRQTHYGLELEVVTFSGMLSPKLPACAKRVVRNWDPERDVPLRTDG